MADTRTPAQTAMISEASSTFPEAARDFQENALLPLLESIHRAENALPQWEDRAAAGAATRAAEQARLLLEDGEVGEALAILQDPAEREAQEPLEEQPFASARKQIENAWADWRTRHGLDESALPRSYPFASEHPDAQSEGVTQAKGPENGPLGEPDGAAPSGSTEAVLTPDDRSTAAELSAWRPDAAPAVETTPKDDFYDPELSPWKPQTSTQGEPDPDPAGPEPADALLSGQSLANETSRPEQAQSAPEGAPQLDLPSDQEAAALATQREAEEQAARSLLAGKSPEATQEDLSENTGESLVDAQQEKQVDAPQADTPPVQPSMQPAPASSAPAAADRDPQDEPDGSPSQETHIGGRNVTIRSPGLLTTLAQGFNQRRSLQLQSRAEKQKAQRLDAAREKFSDFTLATQVLESQSAALLQHPVMEAVRQAAPNGLHQADTQQQALVGAIVRASPDFQTQVQALQNQHAETIRRFDVLAPEMEEIPDRERRAYADIAHRHLKKTEEYLGQIPDQKGNSLWERLRESFRAIGQRLGMIAPDAQIQQVALAAASMPVHRPGRR
ncbi:hypothetical protein [Acidithiobacillus sp.]|uniref:hypothetical protein n=1 Tax=Acidithiobacillus sp. TaxID=1872118 RepID=UPI002612360D|nr:hypothetical protein [Acidithiobacillus sp.]MDD2748798.1 hypothetical protein [Acidithiobacillus sp.]MDD5280299.1 hypothetical protein [Acidithiobacillus sp.]